MVSPTFSIKALASILSIISVTNAHMIMKTPIPYGKGTINNSPLLDDGSDFPCKNIFSLANGDADINHMAIGESQTLSFTGSAVHGGGSCQVSLTTDLVPNKASKWMVIKSIEGGCPANVDGNLPSDPSGGGASTFQYSIPQGVQPGQYTIAWTWFNRIGNREMYMNCGRANIVASKKRYAPATPKPLENRAANFPDIFKANLKIFTCTVALESNIAFPNPGAVVQTAGSNLLMSPCGPGAAAATAAPTAGAGSGQTSVTSSAAAVPTGGSGGFSSVAATTAATTAPKSGNTSAAERPSGFASGTGSGSSPQPTANPGVFASGAASQSAPAATTAVQASSTAVASVAPVPNSGSGSGGNGSSLPSGPNIAGSKCSPEGQWACASDGKSFQRCASGIWSAPMQMAAGTGCTPGQSMNLNMKLVSPRAEFHKHGSTHQHARRVVGLSS